MKKRLLLIIVLVACACLLSRAQEGTITIHLKQANLKQVFDLIQKQSAYIIFYNDTQVDAKQKASVSVDSGTVNDVLDQAFVGTDLIYKVFDRQIIILKEQKSPALSEFQTDNSDRVSRVVKGNVTDESGNLLAGVSVFIPGKSIGVTTNFGGHYQLKVPGDTKFLTFSFVGMKTTQEDLTQDSILNVVLLPDNFGVEEVVVSALGIQRKERSLSFAQQTIDYEGVSSREYSFVSSLSGKVSGMQVTRSASGAGGSSKVLLRGNKSLSTSSEPLFVIDGIPMVNNKGRQLGLFDGGDQGDGLSQLNPDDIESITVLKGANAAALYGSQGANGVIIINTKKGEVGDTKIGFSTYFTVEKIQELPDFQFRYGAEGGASQSWSYQRGDYASDYIRNFFQRGTNLVNSLSVSGGNQRTTTYFSASNKISEGVIPTNRYEKMNLSFKQSTSLLNNRLRLASSVVLVNEKVKNKYGAGYYLNPLTGLYLFPRERDFSAYAQNYQFFDTGRNMYLQNWFVEDHFQSNPYWIIHNEPREDLVNRLIGGVNADLQINEYFRLAFRGNYDYSVKAFEEKHQAGSNITNVSANGRWVYTKVNDELIYGDAILFYNKDFGAFQVEGIVGTSYQKSTFGHGVAVDTNTTGLIYPNEFSFQNIDPNVVVSSVLSSRLIKEAVFGNLQLGYDNKLFLDFSGRNDWASSLFGTGNDSYFYPSVGFAGIITELLELPKFINFGKLRGSYSVVSNEVPFNRVNPQHTITRVGVLFNTTKSFENLKPEKINSIEIGSDWKLWNNRFGVDFTWYKVISRDQFIELPAQSGSGYTTYYVNAGKVTNGGVELTAYVSPVKTSKMEWQATFNYAENNNRIVALHPSLKDPIVLSSNEGYQLIIKEGGSFGDIFAHKFLRDEYGRILLNEDGTIPKTERPEYIGNSNPRWSLGFNNRFAYRNFSAELLIGGKFGGKVISQTESMLDGYGVSERTAIARDRGAVNIDAVLPSGRVVRSIDPKLYYTTVGERDGIKEMYTYKRDNIRLSQIMLSYKLDLKDQWLKQLQLSLLAQNLFFIYRDAPFDPEVTLNTMIEDQAIDSFTVPPTRSFGLRMKFQF